MSVPRSNWLIRHRESTPEVLVIADEGHPHYKFKTVTNDADAVVRYLILSGKLPASRRLFYYDSYRQLAELLHNGEHFLDFAPAGDLDAIRRQEANRAAAKA